MYTSKGSVVDITSISDKQIELEESIFYSRYKQAVKNSMDNRYCDNYLKFLDKEVEMFSKLSYFREEKELRIQDKRRRK